MNIIPIDKDDVSKPEVENIVKDKIEYKHLISYLYTKGLKIFSYNHFTDKVEEVIIKYSDTIHIVPRDGELVAVDMEFEKAFVDPRLQYFEALNLKSAIARVKRYKAGKLKELCNLREPSKEGIKFW